MWAPAGLGLVKPLSAHRRAILGTVCLAKRAQQSPALRADLFIAGLALL
jgi:hypothetical protein